MGYNHEKLMFFLIHSNWNLISRKENYSALKMETNFETLSQLVLVDVIASLPLEHVVRMACLGHDRLRQTSSLKWVADRMSEVNFITAL